MMRITIVAGFLLLPLIGCDAGAATPPPPPPPPPPEAQAVTREPPPGEEDAPAAPAEPAPAKAADPAPQPPKAIAGKAKTQPASEAKQKAPKAATTTTPKATSTPKAITPTTPPPKPTATAPQPVVQPTKPKSKVVVPSTARVHVTVPAGLQADLDKDPRMQPWANQVIGVIDKCHAQNSTGGGVIEVLVTMHENSRPNADIKKLPSNLSPIVACATGGLMRIKMPLFTGSEGARHTVKIHFN